MTQYPRLCDILAGGKKRCILGSGSETSNGTPMVDLSMVFPDLDQASTTSDDMKSGHQNKFSDHRLDFSRQVGPTVVPVGKRLETLC